MKSYRFIPLILLIFCLKSEAQSRKINLTAVLQTSDPVQIEPARLKYNKDFAYSFTFDDGLDDTFTLAFRLFKGGKSEVDNQQYPGLKYTDGCGNLLPFTASVAWYSANNQGVDIHSSGTNGFMTWSQSLQLDQANWTFINHSYDHSSGGLESIDYEWQLRQNDQTFYSRIGRSLNYVTPPSGDPNYIEPAFKLGAPAVFTSNAAQTQSNGQHSQVDQKLTYTKPVYWRRLINSYDHTPSGLKSEIDQLLTQTGPNYHLWINEFTHRVKYELYGGSMKFEDFKIYLESLESDYGARGLDNGLFANSVEVFEYLKIRDQIVIRTVQTGNQLQITLDFSSCPWNFRYYDLSLLIRGAKITNMETDKGQVNFSNKPDYSLVNIDLPDYLYTETSPLEELPALKMEIAPNPSNGEFYLLWNEPVNQDYQFQLLDQTGKTVALRFNWLSPQTTYFDFQGMKLAKGLYFLKVQNADSQMFLKKILIE